MSKTWKGVALTIVILLVIAFLYNLLSRSGPSESDKAADNQQYNLYHEYLKKADQRNIEYYERLKEEFAISKEIANEGMRHQGRYEKLLDRWEKQADRMDAILLRLENK